MPAADRKPNIGSLDRRIEIQEPTESRTDTGSVDTAWTAVARCYAKVAYPLTGNKEAVEGDQPVATTRVQFSIRYRDGLNEKMRILYSSDYYNIIPPIAEIGRKDYLVITAEKQF